jgi:hypothetical protein
MSAAERLAHRAAEHVEKTLPPQFGIPAAVLAAGTETDRSDSSGAGAISMLMMKERRPAIRTLRGWAIAVLQEAGAIRECDEHG